MTNLVQHRVRTEKITAPPQIATTTSLSPNTWWGRETTQNAIITADTMAPANALTNADAMGCVVPRTAPKRPATTAMAKGKRF